MKNGFRDRRNILLLSVFPALFAGCLLTAAALDPAGFMHDRGLRIGIIKDMRKQAAGVLNIMPDMDSIILGTSMLENTSAREAEDKIGGTFANISISGGSFYERAYILDHTLRHRDMRRVIYSMDESYLSQRMEHGRYPAHQYAYLYDTNRINNLKAYYAAPIFKCLVRKKRKRLKCMSDDLRFDHPNAWAELPEHNVRFGGLDRWFAAHNNPQIIESLKSIAEAGDSVESGSIPQPDDEELVSAIAMAIDYIDEYLLSYVRSSPDTQFDLVFPPYSRIRFARWHQVEIKDARVHEAVIRYLVGQQEVLGNIALYAYEDQDFIDDLANYKDTGHYHQRYNSMILDSIRDGTHRVDAGNVDQYLNQARVRAEQFDLIGLRDRINEYLASKSAQN